MNVYCKQIYVVGILIWYSCRGMVIYMDNKRVAIVLLNFNNAEETIKCADRLSKYVPYAHIFIVDNNSTDNSYAMLSNVYEFNEISIVHSEINGGYAYGNNIGVKKAIQSGFEYICILNNDVVVKDDFLMPLINGLINNPSWGVVGSCIATNDNEVVNTGNKIDMFSTSFNHAINIKLNDIHEEYIESDFLLGACLVFHRSLIKSVGLLPENYFLNFEETEWCLKIKKQGFKVVCITNSVIFHEESKTISKVSGLQVYFLRRNIVMFELRNADAVHKFVFFFKLSILAITQTIYHRNFDAAKAYIDGLTGSNQYQFLIK